MIVAGFGFRSAASMQSLEDAFARAGQTAVDAIATAQDKSRSPVFQKFAKSIGARVIPINAEALTNATTMTQSKASQTNRATGSVAEAAALAALGPDAALQAPRFISSDRMATCAIAKGPTT